MVRYAYALTAMALGLAAGLTLTAPAPAWAQVVTQQEPNTAEISRVPGQDALTPILPPASIAQGGGCPVGSAIGAEPSMWTPKQRAMIELWDTNNDGKISVAEQTACLGQIGAAAAINNQMAPLPETKPN